MKVSSVVWVPGRKNRPLLSRKDFYHLICFTPLALCVSVFVHLMMSTSPVTDLARTDKVIRMDNPTFANVIISRCNQIHRYRQIIAENTSWPISASFKVIVLTYNQGDSLERCLEALQQAFYNGKRIDLSIFIDRSKSGEVYSDVISVATDSTWTHGGKMVNVWNDHVGLCGQWIDTLRPKHQDDFGIILEDDVEVSQYYYLWLFGARMAYSGRPDIAGYTLQRGTLRADQKDGNVDLLIEATEPIFLHELLGTWGYAPEPRVWADFRRWFHNVSCDKSYDPIVDGLHMSQWYTMQSKHQTMWMMWHLRYVHERSLYTVYANLDKWKTLASSSHDLRLHFFMQNLSIIDRKDFKNFNSSDYTQLNGRFKFPVHPMKIDWNETYLKRSGK